MLINGVNYLLLKRRGCNYRDCETVAKSDVGNYRVYVRFTDKNGIDVCGDLSKGYVYDTSKRKPRIVNDVALNTDLQFENERGCWQYHPATNPKEYTYNLADILKFINSIAKEHYDAIKWYEELEVIQPRGKNFTPASLIHEWAKRNHVETYSNYGTIKVKLYTGTYKYMAYSIAHISDTMEKVTVILEEA